MTRGGSAGGSVSVNSGRESQGTAPNLKESLQHFTEQCGCTSSGKV